jgi:hypothetical protein
MRTACIIIAAVAAFFATERPIDAKIAPIPLPERVAKADFIGIIECVTAGETCAKFKVIESCRGAKAGAEISIRTFARFTGPQFRAHLVGDRFVAIAPRAGPHDQFYRIGANLPIAWRRLHADYELPYGQGPMLLNEATQKIYEDAKKLALAKPKEEYKLPGPDREPIWQAPAGPKPDAAQLDAWRKLMAAPFSPLKNEESAKARRGLIAYDPTPIFLELQAWEPPANKIGGRPTETTHAKASFAAHHCGVDREKHLKILLRAENPLIRTTGAVYLCFENEKLGKEELNRLTKLEGEAGAWAALTLARRGDKTAVPRLLEVFTGPLTINNKQTLFERNLCQQALVLFSNSAQKSGIAQPPRASGWMEHTDPKEIRAWWKQSADRIILHDPWMEKLARQKID